MTTTNYCAEVKHTEEDIVNVIASVLEIDAKALTDQTTYQSIPQWDSLRHINLMLALEKKYGIVINGRLVTTLNSVQAIKAYINSKVANHKFKTIDATSPANGKTQPVQLYRGLNGVNYDNSTISFIDGQNGKLLHRGYAIQELAEHASFEELSYLLLYNKLPNAKQLQDFKLRLIAERLPSLAVISLMKATKNLTPTDALRTIISALPMFAMGKQNNDVQEIGLKLIAQMPFIIAAHHRIRRNKKIIFPNAKLSHAANFLYMLTGKLPSDAEVKILNQDMVLHAEHGSNASTFVARVVTGTQADIYAAVTAAIAAFGGALHGGALEKVFSMLQEIAVPQQAANYVAARISKNLPVYGFGHRVYRTEDPRATQLRKAARTISLAKGELKWLQILEEINKAMQPHAKLGMNVNVDFYAAVTYHLLGIPQELFVPVFIMSRIAGWVAHIQEQLTNNILIRPRLNYIGASECAYVQLNQRN